MNNYMEILSDKIEITTCGVVHKLNKFLRVEKYFLIISERMDYYDNKQEQQIDKELFTYIINNINNIKRYKNYIYIELKEYNLLIKLLKLYKIKEKINGNY